MAMRRIRSFFRAAASLAVLAVVGCASRDGSTDATEGALGAAAPATITFDSSFHQHVTGRLVAGSKARIHYAADRLPSCRGGLNDGSPAWTITGYARTNGGEAKTFYVAGHSADPTVDSEHPPDPEIDLASGGDLALWFEVHDRFGCSGYDSDYGANFHFDVDGPKPGGSGPGPVMRFLATGAPTVTGDLVAGSKLAIEYDASRLPDCRGDANGQPGWTITGYAQANGGAPRSFYVAGLNPDPMASGSIAIPLESGRLVLWFQVTSRFGCSKYDSKEGANYVFDVR
jgi:hypothetical protein